MKAFGVLALAFLLDSIKTFYEVGNCCGLNVCDSNHVLKSEPPAAMASEAGPWGGWVTAGAFGSGRLALSRDRGQGTKAN